MVRIFHQRAKCIGCNYCVESAPFRWAMNESDGKCDLLDGKNSKEMTISVVSDDEYESLKEAAQNCPVNIIRIEKF